MDIYAYDYLYEGLVDYNNKLGNPMGNSIVHFAPENPKFPLTVFNEIRNVSNELYNTDFDRVSNTGYVIRIYAKTKGNITKQEIARVISQIVDKYLSYNGLLRTSYNSNESMNDNSIYEIIMTYTGKLHENRRKFI